MKNLTILQKFKHRVTIWPSNSITAHTLRRTENISPHKVCKQMFISSIIHNSLTIRTIQTFIKWWVNKQIWHIHTHNSIYMKCPDLQIHGQKKISGCQGLGEGRMGSDCYWIEGFFFGWWKCFGIWNFCTNLWIYQNVLKCTL